MSANKKSKKSVSFDEFSARKLAALLRLLGSDRDGEILSAVAAIRRLLASAELDLHDLASVLTSAPAAPEPPKAPEPEPWRETVLDLLRTHGECRLCLTEWDRTFLSNLAGYYTKQPSVSQLDIVDKIADKAGRLHHAAA